MGFRGDKIVLEPWVGSFIAIVNASKQNRNASIAEAGRAKSVGRVRGGVVSVMSIALLRGVSHCSSGSQPILHPEAGEVTLGTTATPTVLYVVYCRR